MKTRYAIVNLQTVRRSFPAILFLLAMEFYPNCTKQQSFPDSPKQYFEPF